jgi:hypothetical protein
MLSREDSPESQPISALGSGPVMAIANPQWGARIRAIIIAPVEKK